MAKFKITQEVDKCLGCGACSSACPNWQPNDGGKYVPQQVEVEDAGCNQQAADVCPVQCIKIEEIK